jgi:hypothetical protein
MIGCAISQGGRKCGGGTCVFLSNVEPVGSNVKIMPTIHASYFIGPGGRLKDEGWGVKVTWGWESGG